MADDSPIVVDKRVGDDEKTVNAFVIPHIDDPNCTNVRSFQIKELKGTKEQVAKAKRLYDKPYAENAKQFYYITRQFEHANTFRQEVHKKYKTPNVSNAWLKAYELFIHYNVFPQDPTDKFVYFDNAAFPGSFILAAWHLVHTKCDIKDFQWYGSSLLSAEEQKSDKGTLEDKYKLYENYPKNWLMDENNNGDVTSWENQQAFKKTLGGTVDLYTSDLGFDVSEDYNKQEELQAHANLGQVLTGLLVLKEGGNMITKQYSYFEPITISLMGLMTRVFDRVEICKPMFSKAGNSETYLVGLGYKGDPEVDGKKVTDILLDRLRVWNLKPLVTKKCLGNTFLSAIIKSQKQLASAQIEKLTGTISEYNRFVKSKKTDRKHVSNTNKFAKKNLSDLKRWVLTNPLKKLPHDKRLRVKEVLAWKPREGKY